MKVQFNYSPKNPLKSQMIPILVALAMIVVPFVYPFNLRLGRLVILTHPYTMYLFVAVGIGLLIYIFDTVRTDTLLSKSAKPIVVEDGRVTLVEIKKKAAIEKSFLISEITSLDFKADDGIFNVSVGTAFYTFDKDNFDSEELFTQFYQMLEVKK